MALPLLLGFGLPALAGSGMLGAGAAATFLGGLSAPTLAGIGAGLGSFLETGDVGKGIQTGLIAGLGGKAMGALTGGGNAALSGAIGGTEGAAQAAIKASAVEGGKNAFLQSVTNKSLQGGLAGAVLPGVGTAALVGSAMNPPTMKMPEKKTYDIPPPMPRIRSYQPKKNPDSTAEETMISYSPPMAQPEAEEDLPFTNYASNYRPPAGMYGNMFAEGGEVKKMRGGGMLGTGGILSIGHAGQLFPQNQYGHPAFNPLANALTQGINSTTGEKVKPFIQEVETMAKNRFGPNVFQQQSFGIADSISPTPQLPIYDTNFGPRPVDPFARPNFNLSTGLAEEAMLFDSIRPDSNNAIDMLPSLNRIPKDPFSLVDLQGVNPLARTTALGFAEGGEVETPEDMNEKDVIVEAVKAIKGLSDAPEIALGIFLDKYGQEALEDLVQKVQSGVLDDTIERFSNGDKGMVEGMGDGSGEDDMIPASLDGEQDVLLTEGEFVMRQPTTKAIQDEFGSDFLDIINQSEEKAPEKIREMVGVES